MGIKPNLHVDMKAISTLKDYLAISTGQEINRIKSHWKKKNVHKFK